MANAQTGIVRVAEDAAIALTPQTIKAYINQYATVQEVALFLNQCSMFGLNPFKREIYLIKYSSSQPATFVVGYEVYLKRAERSDKWAGLESGTEGEGKELKAWAKVYRKDWKAPLYHEVYLDEYIQKKQDGNPTRFWAEKPRTMLKKVAISQAFRMAFPDELSGMPYTAEEMPVDHGRLPKNEVLKEDVEPGEVEAEELPTFTPDSGAKPGQDEISPLIARICKEKKKDPAEVLAKIRANVKAAFKRDVSRIPDDLRPDEVVKVKDYLERLLRA